MEAPKYKLDGVNCNALCLHAVAGPSTTRDEVARDPGLSLGWLLCRERSTRVMKPSTLMLWASLEAQVAARAARHSCRRHSSRRLCYTPPHLLLPPCQTDRFSEHNLKVFHQSRIIQDSM